MIKQLMVKRELMKNDKLKDKDWSRFIPQFKKKNPPKKKKKKTRKPKKPYTPFPPLPVMSKVDKELESGEFFLKEAQRKREKRNEKSEAKKAEREERKRKRKAEFVAPAEKKMKDSAVENEDSLADLSNNLMKHKVKKKKKLGG